MAGVWVVTTYSVRYVHKVAPRSRGIGPDVTLSSVDLASRQSLGAALRKQRVLMRGARVVEFRADETSGCIVAFPSVPGLTSYWHAVILEPKP